jgi:cytochrome c
MKILSLSLFAALSIAGHTTANANDALAQKSNCYACHAKETKILGPAFTEVAKRYAADSTAVVALTQTISKGSTGKWGKIPMPANEQLSAEDATALATWIMSLK